MYLTQYNVLFVRVGSILLACASKTASASLRTPVHGLANLMPPNSPLSQSAVRRRHATSTFFYGAPEPPKQRSNRPSDDNALHSAEHLVHVASTSLVCSEPRQPIPFTTYDRVYTVATNWYIIDHCTLYTVAAYLRRTLRRTLRRILRRITAVVQS